MRVLIALAAALSAAAAPVPSETDESWGAYRIRHLPLPGVVGGMALLKGGGMAAACGDGQLYFLEPDGRLRAQFSLDGFARGSPVILKDGTIAQLVPKHDDKLGYDVSGKVLFVAPDGRKRGEYAVQGQAWALTALRDGGVAVGVRPPGVLFLGPAGELRGKLDGAFIARQPDEYAGVSGVFQILELPDRRLLLRTTHAYILDRDRRTVRRWAIEGETSVQPLFVLKSGAVVAKGRKGLVLTSAAGTAQIRVPIRANGTSQEEHGTNPERELGSVSELANGGFVVGTREGFIYVVDKNGRERWHFKASGPVVSAAAELRNGTIVAGSDDHRLYFLTADGALLGRYKAEVAIAGRAIEPQEGVLAVAASGEFGASHNLYLFTPTGRPFADTPPASGRKCRVVGGSAAGLGGDAMLPCSDPEEMIRRFSIQSSAEAYCARTYADSRPTNIRVFRCAGGEATIPYDCEVCSDAP